MTAGRHMQAIPKCLLLWLAIVEVQVKPPLRVHVTTLASSRYQRWVVTGGAGDKRRRYWQQPLLNVSPSSPTKSRCHFF